MKTKGSLKLELEPRSAQKKKVRALRREGIIPGVVYGKGFETMPVQVNAKQFESVYRKSHGTLIIDAVIEGKTTNVLIHNVQRDQLSQTVVHVDFLKVDLKRDVTVDIPLVFVGTSPAEEEGTGTIGHEATSISIKCPPSNIPTEIQVDVSSIRDKHDAILASGLKLPEGASLGHGVSEDKVIATFVPTKKVEVEAPEGAPEGAAGPAE